MEKETLYSRNLQISPFSSLNFDHNWKRSFQMDMDYVQRFDQSDRIRVQYSTFGNYDYIVSLVNNDTGQAVYPERVLLYRTETKNTYEVLMNYLKPGSYTFQIWLRIISTQLMAHSTFRVEEEEPENTVKITYNHRRNEFDTFFDPNHFFDFRAEGCFLPSESSFPVDTEGFRDQRFVYRQLSAMPYRKDVLSVGGAFGVPNWVAEKLNNIFSLSFILVDDSKYARSEGAVPELTSIHADYPMFVYKIELEKDQRYTKDSLSGGDFNFDYNQDYKTIRYEI